MNLDTLAKFSERFTTEQLIVSTDRCLSARFKKAGCRSCVGPSYYRPIAEFASALITTLDTL